MSLLIEIIDKIFSVNPHLNIVIRSSISVALTNELLARYIEARVIFSNEFIR